MNVMEQVKSNKFYTYAYLSKEDFDYSAALKAAKSGRMYKGVLLKIVEK